MIETKFNTYNFLSDCGEMGDLIRKFDWSQTSIGSIDRWPQSLRTMVDVILHSQVPMFLWWGEELIQFYNDAYRPTLGNNGKHPKALGQPGIECWPETWDIIKSLIDTVLRGGSIWREDQLVPIFRNGKMEEAYWTYGYSPVRDESASIAGILVICNETTSKVRAMQRMQDSERTMSSIVMHAPIGICFLSGEPLQAELANNIFLQLSGKSREELLSRPYWEIFPELKDRYSQPLKLVMDTGIPFERKEEKVALTRKGIVETIYVDVVIERMRSPDEDLKKTLIILAIDVTDKVRARQKIEESEQRYKTLITESTVAIAMYVGEDFRVQYVNDIMIRYWGKDKTVIGKPFHQAIPELHGQPFLDLLKEVFRSGKTYTGKEEEAILDAGGHLKSFYYNYIYKPLKDAEGKVYGIHHMAMDVTEQVLARKKVEQNEAILRNVILKAPVAMCILRGPEFVVEIANEKMFRIWGKERDQMIGRPVFSILTEAKEQGFEQILQKVFETGESFSAVAVPILLPREEGVEPIHVNFLYEPFREADGNISGVITVATDVTDQVLARQRIEDLVAERTQELADSNKNLKRSNDELAQFAYIASHDLQEPARKINTFTEMLQKSLKGLDERERTLLAKIEQSSTRMLSLIRDVLGYSQLLKEYHRTSKIDLNQTLDNVRTDFELLIEEKSASIIADPLPIVEGIPVQVNQLFSNLISNALKFAHKERKPAILIKASPMNAAELSRYPELRPDLKYFRISFQDNGIGFNQRNARQIFDIFQRLHGRSEYEGTGIGLAMCKRIAQNHKGDILAESVEGKGATFHVFFPESQEAN